MDVIALTETSEKEDIGFLNNVEMDEYLPKGALLFMLTKTLPQYNKKREG